MSFSERLEKVPALRDALRQRRDAMVSLAVKSLRFTVKDSAREVDVTIDRLGMFPETAELLWPASRCAARRAAWLSMLAYNGS